MLKLRLYIKITILLLLFPFSSQAEILNDTFKLSGIISDFNTGEKMQYVSISLSDKNNRQIYTMTDNQGEFHFKQVKKGEYKLSVSFIGYKTHNEKLNIVSDKHLNIKLRQESYTLNDIVVTASESKGTTSTSKIDRKAMEHLQPSCFTDLLALIPGGKTQLPMLTQANTIKLRETGSKSSGYDISSLGTIFVTDGIPISTNGNMQVVRQASSTNSGDVDAYRNHTNKGVDMRTISTDNIENVEIIRGIASAEYGDLTSGVVIINRKLKATPWEARFKADPYSKLLYVGKGFKVDEHDFTINTSLDYLDAKRDPRNKLENYKRLTGSVRLQKIWKFDNEMNLRWKSALDYTGSFDDEKNDPEILVSKDDRYSSSYNMMSMNHSLSLFFPEKYFFKSLNFDFATRYEISRIEQDKLVSLSRDQIASTTLEEGEHDGIYLPYKYLANVVVDGKPFNSFAKLKALFSVNTNYVKQDFNLGLEWKTDKNFGKGQIYDPSRPLSPGTPYRPRNYSDIPSQQQVSAYLQDDLKANIGNHTLIIAGGIRALSLLNLSDKYYLKGKVYLDPRVNIQWKFPSIQLGKHSLNTFISGGFGQQTKFPTLLHLYPDMIYTDIIQLNYFNLNPDYRRVNLYTFVENPTNYDLKPARNNKWEIRLGASMSGHNFSVTYFHELTETGFRTSNTVRPYQYKDYDETSIDNSLVNKQPDLNDFKYKNDTILGMYGRVTNGSCVKKEGIEFQYSSKRINVIKTRFTVNGAWFKSTYSNSQPMFKVVSNQIIDNTPVSSKYIGYYDTQDGAEYQSFNTNFMADTYIQKLGLSFSVTAECTWFETSKTLQQNGYPLAYMNTKGEILPFTEEDLHHPYKQWLVQTYNPSLFNKKTIPFYAFFNLKVTKSFGKHLNLALFVDRILDYMPDYVTESGMTVRRTAKPYFGIELNVKI